MIEIKVAYYCDICGSPLPEKFVKKSINGNDYYFSAYYDDFRLDGGKHVNLAGMNVFIKNCQKKEICHKCRADILRDVLRKLESELEKTPRTREDEDGN